MEGFIQKGNMFTHDSGQFRIRERKGRCLEVEYSSHPGLWFSTGTRDISIARDFALSKLAKGGRLIKSKEKKLKNFGGYFFGTIDDSIIRRKNERFGRFYTDGYYKSLCGNYKNYIKPYFGEMDPARITDVMIEDWYTNLNGIRNGCQLKSCTKLSVLETLGLLMKELVRQGVIDRNPMDTVERLRANDKAPRPAFTLEEVQRMFPAERKELNKIWRNLKWALYFSIMADTGWRPAEVMGLSRSSFYLSGVFQVESVDSSTKVVKPSIKTTNSGQKYKIGILSDYSKKLLAEYLPSVEGEYLFEYFDGTFPTAMANRVLWEAMKKAGVPLLSPATGQKRTQYSFRHFFSTYMHDHRGIEGISEEDISEMMAHVDYRPEYDHRTAQMMIFRLEGKAGNVINAIRERKVQ